MSEVRRWAHTVKWEGLQISAAYMAIDHGGEYVMHADYAALEAENAALKHRCGMLGLELENAEERRIQAERQVAILRQHKADYMEAAEGTRKALEAECERLADALDRQSVITGDYIARCQRLADELAITRRVIDRIGQLCTTPHESKERFIRRVQSVIEWERAAQQDQPQ